MVVVVAAAFVCTRPKNLKVVFAMVYHVLLLYVLNTFNSSIHYDRIVCGSFLDRFADVKTCFAFMVFFFITHKTNTKHV